MNISDFDLLYPFLRKSPDATIDASGIPVNWRLVVRDYRWRGKMSKIPENDVKPRGRSCHPRFCRAAHITYSPIIVALSLTKVKLLLTSKKMSSIGSDIDHH